MRFPAIAFFGLLVLPGCGSFLRGEYDPEVPVHVWIQTSPHMNAVASEGRPIDLFAFRVRNPGRFRAASVDELLSGALEVPGGVFLERRFVRPGESVDWLLPAMETSEFRHLGLVAAYTDPHEVRRVVAKIPEEGAFDLDLGPSGVRFFGPSGHTDDPLIPGSE